MLIKANELQEKLNISKATYYRYVNEGMPFLLDGSKKVYDINAVYEWLNNRNSSVATLLSIGNVYSNSEIADIFKCSTQGGMRRSNTTNSLVLFTDHSDTENVYEDKWIDDVLHYTGMGLEDDQKLEGNQNLTLYNSRTNGVRVYLFETFSPTKHTYIGEIELADDSYTVEEEDINKKVRKVYKFPLRVKFGGKALEEHQVSGMDTKKERLIYLMDEEDIRQRAMLASKANASGYKFSGGTKKAKPSSRKVTTMHYDRNPYIAQYVKFLAKGNCMLCDQPAPFKDELGRPYLECHHIEWLSRGGLDVLENCAAVCSNCHSKLHVLNASNDVEKLKNIAKDYPLNEGE